MDLYGKLNNEIVKKEYAGSTTETAKTIVDNTSNVIKTEVKKVPNKLKIDYFDKEQGYVDWEYDGSEEVEIHIPQIADVEALKEKVNELDVEINGEQPESIVNQMSALEQADIDESQARSDADTLIEADARKIQVKEEIDPQTNEKTGRLEFYEYGSDQVTRYVQGGFQPDNETVELNSERKLTLKKVYTDNTITGNGINGNPLSISTSLATKQNVIDSNNKLSSDLVDDTNKTHLFVSSSEKETWSGKQDALDSNQLAAVNSGIDDTKVSQISTNTNDISIINGKIPVQATSSNQLADKDFVNSSIATNTANFRGTFDVVSDLGLTTDATNAQISQALELKMQTEGITPTNNDYCFVSFLDATDPTIATKYERFKFNGTAWEYEYTLNNSSFTAQQWAAINSGITQGLVEQILPCLTGVGDPSINTAGEVGQLYLNTSTNSLFQCVSKNSQGTQPETYTYTWLKVVDDNKFFKLDESTQYLIYGGSDYRYDKTIRFPSGNTALESNIYFKANTNDTGICIHMERSVANIDSASLKIIHTNSNSVTTYGTGGIGRSIGSSTNYSLNFPNKSGTIAVTSDIPLVDSTPTSGSSNAVSSGGVYTALAGKQDTLTPLSRNDTREIVSDILYPTIVTFTVDNADGLGNSATYDVEQGMTWVEWVESAYNIDGWKFSFNYLINRDENRYIIAATNNFESVINNAAYQTMAYSGGN